MKVVICGTGQVGWQIARHLAREKNDVAVIDTNAEVVRRAIDTLDVTGHVGFASHPEVLERAGARDADMIIAATQSDEVNMVACQVAHSVFGVPRKIARVRSAAYLDPGWSDIFRRDHMPIDVVISPELEVAEAALRRLSAPTAFENQSFFSGQMHFLGIALDEDCPVLGTPLRQLTDLFSSLRAIVGGVRRGDKIFVPLPDDQLFAGDRIYVFTHHEDTLRTLEVFGKPAKRQERLVIIGGGNVGLSVAQALERGPNRVRVRLIERSRAQAELAADALTKTVVMYGDGLNSDILEEAGIDQADAILALTDDDKTNILAAVRGKMAGAGMSIALVNDPTLLPLIGELDVDAQINPRATTVSSILRHIRHGRVRGVYSIGDGEAEVLEVQVLSTSPIAGKLIRDAEIPAGAIIGGVLKPEGPVKPLGNTRIDVGDLVLFFALARDVPGVERLLQVSIDYF